MIAVRACQACQEAGNPDDERFCISCGADMDGAGAAGAAGGPRGAADASAGAAQEAAGGDEPTRIIPRGPARLTVNGEEVAGIDGSYRLVGRADLRKHTKKDPDLISRSHFTVYRKGSKYIVADGPTPVQDRRSERGTSLNGTRLEGEAEMKPGDVITVSDVDAMFEA